MTEHIIRCGFFQEEERLKMYPVDKYYSASIGYPQRFGNMRGLSCIVVSKDKMTDTEFRALVVQEENANPIKYGC